MKKNDVKKKKKPSAGGLGYCPFSVCTGSRYRELYRDTRLGRPVWACDKGATRPGWRAVRYYDMARRGLRHGRLHARACGSALARGLAGRVCRDTINCIVTRERPCH